MSVQHLPQAAVVIEPALRTLWLLGLPLAAAAWAWSTDRAMIVAALFAGGAAALLPAAMLETALPIVITHSPGGGGGMIGFFWHGVGDLVLALMAAGAALLLRRRAQAGGALPQGALAALFAGFYAAMIVPRHTPLTDALLPGLGGPSDPLAPLMALQGIAPWIAALCLGAVVALAFSARQAG